MSFAVLLPESPFLVVNSRAVVVDGAVDAGDPVDDVWELEFGECVTAASGETVRLLEYEFMSLLPGVLNGQEICLSGPDNPDVLWTECAGGTVVGEAYPPEGLSYPVGCFPITSTYLACAVDADYQSWSLLKARY